MWNRTTGQLMTELEHIEQSIVDIITTPVGTRLMLRDYGSNFLEMVDKPFNEATKLALIAATGEAIERWEKRVRVKNISFANSNPSVGNIVITVTFEIVATGAVSSTTVGI